MTEGSQLAWDFTKRVTVPAQLFGELDRLGPLFCI